MELDISFRAGLSDDAAAFAEKRAAELNLSPDQFLAAAIRHYLGYLDTLSLRRDIDELLARLDRAESAA